jgi:hypothetical protein
MSNRRDDVGMNVADHYVETSLYFKLKTEECSTRLQPTPNTPKHKLGAQSELGAESKPGQPEVPNRKQETPNRHISIFRPRDNKISP